MLEVLFMPKAFDNSYYDSMMEQLPPAKRRRLADPCQGFYKCFYETPYFLTPQYSSSFPDDNCLEVMGQHTSISILPAEILDHIFSFMNISVLRTQGKLVCKSWNQIILSPLFWRDFVIPKTTALCADKYIDILSLPRFSQLQTIAFGWEQKVDDDTISALLEKNPNLLTTLTSLDVQRCNGISDASMRCIARLKNLKHLRLYNSGNWKGISDKGIELLSSLPSLQSLQLNYFKRISNKGLLSLAKLSSLRELTLIGSCLVNDEGIAHLSALTELSSFTISLCGTLTDSCLNVISTSFPALSSLALGYNTPNSSFTNEGLRNLLALGKLKELRLERSWGLLGGDSATLLKNKNILIKKW